MKNQLTPAGIEPATFRFVAQHLNHCATAVPHTRRVAGIIVNTKQLTSCAIFNVNKNPTRCKSMHIFIYCKVALHVSGVTAPIIRSTKNCNRASGTGHNTGTATSLQRGLIGTGLCESCCRPCWRKVAVPVLWTVPEAVVTVFSTPDDGCCDIGNM